MSIPVVYFKNITVSGVVALSALPLTVPAGTPTLYLQMQMDKTQLLGASGIHWKLVKDGSGVAIDIQAMASSNVNSTYLASQAAGSFTSWNDPSALFGIAFSFNGSARQYTFSTQSAQASLGSSRLGMHVLLLAASAYTTSQVTSVDSVFTDPITVAASVESALISTIVAYLQTSASQTAILKALKSANFLYFQGDEGYLPYTSTLSGMQIALELTNIRVDVSDNSVTNTLVLGDVPLVLNLA